MPLPRTLVYNDLAGDEVKHILQERFLALLSQVPYLQRHLTLPRVRMQLQVTLDCWADQTSPETKLITDQLEIRSESFDLSATVDASRHGKPPDQIREEHGIVPPTPGPAPLSTPGLKRTEDVITTPVTVEGRRVMMPDGSVVDRTGASDKARAGSTVVEQDFGPGRLGRNYRAFGNSGARQGPVESPKFEAFKDAQEKE